MGLTLTTLHIPGDEAAIPPLLKAGESIRTHSHGWTTVLPGVAEDGGWESMKRLAKHIPGSCLLFHYFDDDMFTLLLWQDGKKTASLCTNPEDGHNSRIDRISPAIFGDDRATAALKLIAKCTDLEEQLALAEEALGVSLLEDAKFPPRQVTPGTAAYDAVTARMAALKKRRNAYRAVLLEDAEVPAALRAKYTGRFGRVSDWVETVAVPRTDVQGRPLPETVQLMNPVCRLNDGTRLYAAYCMGQPEERQMHYCLVSDHQAIICRDAEGTVRWVFQPELAEHEALRIRAVRPDVVLVSCGGRQEKLWLLRRRDGQVLHEVVSAHEVFGQLWWIPALERYAFFSRDEGCRRSYTLMDAELNVTRWQDLGDWGFLPGWPVSVEGTRLCTQNETNAIVAFDLADGSIRTTPLEDRAYFRSLPTTETICCSKGDRDVILFDRAGQLISRHRFKADHASLEAEGGQLYVIETNRGDEDACRYWRLEKIDDGGTTWD